MHRHLTVAAMLLASALMAPSIAQEKAEPRVYPAAILPFQERGADVKEYGGQVADILFSELAANPSLFLVDRRALNQTLSEQALSASGMVSADQANQVGRLTGAKLLVTGSVFQVGNRLYLVAKIMGTETSRVAGVSVKGAPDELPALAEGLAKQVAEAIGKQGDKLVAPPHEPKDRVAQIRQKLGAGPRPAILVQIGERHVGQPTVDPAAETEVMHLCGQTGFTVIDPKAGRSSQAEMLLKGEGLSELSGRVGPLVSVSARVELKAIDQKTGRVVVTDRQTAIVVGVSEQIAAKEALQQAAAALAERVLPQLVAGHAKK